MAQTQAVKERHAKSTHTHTHTHTHTNNDKPCGMAKARYGEQQRSWPSITLFPLSLVLLLSFYADKAVWKPVDCVGCGVEGGGWGAHECGVLLAVWAVVKIHAEAGTGGTAIVVNLSTWAAAA